MRTIICLIVIISSVAGSPAFGQKQNESSLTPGKKDSVYITRLDTLLHLQTWISANQMDYSFVYNPDFRLVLAPAEVNNLSFGFSYRFLDLGIGFSPKFMNAQQDRKSKGNSDQFNFRTSFNMHRFNLAFDLSKVNGFYLKNTGDFIQNTIPDSPYVLFPDLEVYYYSFLLRYNVNPNFSTAALVGGTQIQRRTAFTLLPSLQFARFRFRDRSPTSGVQNQSTYSTDLNLLFPIAGSWVMSPKFSATFGVGPSFGVDFFKSVALDDSSKIVLSKGTKFTAGYTIQMAINYHSGRFFAGIESRNRSYGHKIEDLSRLIKKYTYFQLFLGWRLKAPQFAKKSLDWINKISPVDLE